MQTDEEWKNSLKLIYRADDLLVELVRLQDNTLGVGDPYFKDLFEAIINRARDLIGPAC